MDHCPWWAVFSLMDYKMNRPGLDPDGEGEKLPVVGSIATASLVNWKPQGATKVKKQGSGEFHQPIFCPQPSS